MTEIRPIDTSRPFTRLLRVNWNSARSDQETREAGDQHSQHHRDGVGQMGDVGEMPGGVGPDHHELPEGKIHDAGDAKRQRDAESNDAVERPDDDAVQELPENDLGHRRLSVCNARGRLATWMAERKLPLSICDAAADRSHQGSTRVIWIAPPFFMCAMSKSKICSPLGSNLMVHTPLYVTGEQCRAHLPDVIYGAGLLHRRDQHVARGRSRTTSTAAPGRRGSRACGRPCSPR